MAEPTSTRRIVAGARAGEVGLGSDSPVANRSREGRSASDSGSIFDLRQLSDFSRRRELLAHVELLGCRLFVLWLGYDEFAGLSSRFSR